MVLLSDCARHLEADAKILSLFLECLIYLIKKHPFRGHSVDKFLTILGVGFYVWNLLQTISKAGWNYFKISSQSDAPILVEAMRTIYNLDLVPISSSNAEVTVNILEAEDVTLTLVANKKYKEKNKVSFLSSISFFDFKSKVLFIL